MLPLWTVAIDALGKALDLIKFQKANEWRGKAAGLQLEIQREWDKGYNRDDAMLESKMREFKIVVQQAHDEITAAIIAAK